ncbi:MAG: RluA family pseudouridine synthase [Deltaproteobacteria bacterium]|nr:RluA family pseudouridine synthase [Deltaproteobacteria bacterium]
MNDLIFTVTAADAGERLDRYLARQLPQFSRTAIQRAIDAGSVTVDAARSKAKLTVRAGQRIVCRPPAPAVVAHPPIAQPMSLDVLYEDAALVVINKPAGLVVHPGAGRPHGTLVNALVARYGALPVDGEVSRPGIVHRLDQGTSGVMVVARTAAAHRHLVEQFATRVVRKTYIALCYGHVAAEGVIELPIGRHPTDRKRMSTHARRGRSACTRWRVRERFAEHATCVEIDLATGRTHQIRVHFAAVGHPLLGDPVYGGTRSVTRLPKSWQAYGRELDRPALHAWRLQLVHPSTGQAMTWSAPLPDDLEWLSRQLRGCVESTT